MKLSSFVLLAIAANTCAAKKSRRRRARFTPNTVRADSKVGETLMTQARRVNDNGGGNNNVNANNYYASNNGYYYDGVDYNPNNGNNYNNNGGTSDAQAQWYMNWQLQGSQWLTGYSIHFQGCYDTYNWNPDADEDEDVRLNVEHLVRFRLCPSDSCADNKGCWSNYGDYVIDMETFLASHVEALANYEDEDQEWADAEYDGEGEYDVGDYLECKSSGIQIQTQKDACTLQTYYGNNNNDDCINENYGNNGNNGNNDNDNDGGYYYMGPTCGKQGGQINLGFFKDESCTVPADDGIGADMYMALTSTYLPFSKNSMIQRDCISCKEPSDDDNNDQNNYNNDQNNYNGDDAEDEDDITNVCETAYLSSSKCEENLPRWAFNTYKPKNNNGCNYIEGIQVIREDGAIITTNRKAPGHLGSKAAGAVMLVTFGSAFAGLSYYVYYLKNRFERASIEIE